MGVAVAIVSVPGRQSPPKLGDHVMPMLPLIHQSSLKSAFVLSLSSRLVSDRVKANVFPPPLKTSEKAPLDTCSSVVLAVVVVVDHTSLTLVKLKVPVALASVSDKVPFALFWPLVTVPVALLVTEYA